MKTKSNKINEKYQQLLQEAINQDDFEESKNKIERFNNYKNNKFLVIDCSSVIYQIFFVTSKNRDKVLKINDETWTNAVYGFIRFIRTIIKKERFSYICCAFDFSRKSFRTNYFDKYKMQRPKTPSEIIYQTKIIQEFLKLAKIPFFSIENYEADDIIGTIVNKFKTKSEIYIYSSDHDLYQLIDGINDITFCNIQKGMVNPQKINKDNFEEIVKIPLKYFLEYKILKGDQSDNLRGIPGWGPKTILNYLNEFNGLENLLSNIDKISNPKHKKILEANLEQIKLYKKIIPIYCSLDLNSNLDFYKLSNYYKSSKSQQVIDFFKKYKFKSFL